MRSRYGITLDDYERMLEEQDGGCAICGRETDYPLYVDHCHEGGRVRGLLCATCNSGIGKFLDDPDLLVAAAAYLIQHAEQQ